MSVEYRGKMKDNEKHKGGNNHVKTQAACVEGLRERRNLGT